ncbi:MAG: M67 family metallopeptidase [Thermodesulfobacteriota bacterium]
MEEFGKKRLPSRFELSEVMKKDLPDLEIPEDLLNRLIEHARQEYPLESCGILAGKNGKITKFYSMENTQKSSSCYLMEPEEQLRVFREIEEEGLELSAIYHSHPHSPAFPSQRDVDSAFYPDSLILIISLMENKVPQIGAFQIEKGEILKKAVKVNQNK